MSFTIATALSRLAAGKFNLFVTQNGTMDAAQQLARYNAVMEEFWLQGSWPGLHKEITLTSSNGVITLDAAYLRLDGLSATKAYTPPEKPSWWTVRVVPMQFRWQPGGPQYFSADNVCGTVCIDQGDNSSGRRVYQLTGNTTTLDGYTYTGFARKRYVYATSTTDTVIPDCYSALEYGVRSFNSRDERADDADELWAKALAALDASMGQFNQGNEFGVLQTDGMVGMGSVPNLI